MSTRAARGEMGRVFMVYVVMNYGSDRRGGRMTGFKSWLSM